MTYFREVSDLLYQSQQPNRNSSYDYVRVKNLFRRAKIRDDFFQIATALTKYKIIGEERPDQIAEKIYGSPIYDWIVLISNNILNVKNEWPLSNHEFNEYLQRKYSDEELQSPHHYETIALYDTSGKLIMSAGNQVDSNFTVKYFDEKVYTNSYELLVNSYYTTDSSILKSDSTETRINSAYDGSYLLGCISASPVKSISVYEYELAKNENKRNIYLLNNRYLQTAIDDMRNIMSYGFSSQYIDDKTKKGENLRVLSPR
jgi:hypothetical protein